MTRIKWMLAIPMVAVLVVGCSFVTKSNQGNTEPITPLIPVSMEEGAPWTADGIIQPKEYAQYQQMGGMSVYTRISGDVLYMALSASTQGWIAIGFDPEDRMKNADMIMGAVIEGKAVIKDMYSTGPFGPHPVDTQQGGSEDILAVGGMEKDGVTIIEFSRKLNTGDAKDKVIKQGANKVLWAVGETDDITQRHSQRGSAVLDIK